MRRLLSNVPVPSEEATSVEFKGEVFTLVRSFYQVGVDLLMFQSATDRFAVHVVDCDLPHPNDVWGGGVPANMGVYASLSECVAGVARRWGEVSERRQSVFESTCDTSTLRPATPVWQSPFPMD